MTKPAPRPASPERDGPTITARFDGHCKTCNTAIHAGEPICRTTHGTYEHAACHPDTGGRWATEP